MPHDDTPGPMAACPDLCSLHHRVFTALSDISFRRSADGAAVMTVPFGETAASVPLRSLKREFAIADDSADGRMLAMIAESLDFVGSLRLGDRLPAEVLGEGASWTASARYRDAAALRLQGQLVGWLAAMGGSTEALDEDAALRAQLQTAMTTAARALGLRGPEEVLTLLEALAGELSYIESLRDTLLRRVLAMVRKVAHLGLQRTRDGVHQETMLQVQRLSQIAYIQLSSRFAEIDARTAEVMAVLGSMEAERAFIRSSRDWLYRTSRAWSPLLDEWGRTGLVLDELTWGLLARTYQFLAPRYMPVTEWQTTGRRLQPRTTAVPW